MNKRILNNKGFTLIEIMAAIILLAIVMSVTTVSVISFINASKEKSYDLLVSEIKTGLENFYLECENQAIMGNSGSSIKCHKTDPTDTFDINDGITIGDLVTYGFLKSSEKESGNKVIKNPKTNEVINKCKYKISLSGSSGNYEYSIIADSNNDKIVNDSDEEICPDAGELNK